MTKLLRDIRDAKSLLEALNTEIINQNNLVVTLTGLVRKLAPEDERMLVHMDDKGYSLCPHCGSRFTEKQKKHFEGCPWVEVQVMLGTSAVMNDRVSTRKRV